MVGLGILAHAAGLHIAKAMPAQDRGCAKRRDASEQVGQASFRAGSGYATNVCNDVQLQSSLT
jgi:hypothetical protein